MASQNITIGGSPTNTPPPTPVPQNNPTAPPTSGTPGGLDPTVLNLAKSIRQVESGGNYHAMGADGEIGAYQITPGLWSGTAPKYGIHTPLETSTPQEQNAFAYNYILDLKNKGYNPAQIASVWNSGNPDPYHAGQGTSHGGAAYNTPKYATDVYNYYQQFKGQDNGVNQPASQPPSIGGFLGNVVQSGANFLGNLGNAVVHPLDTLQTLGKIPVGGLQELGGQTTDNTQVFDAFKQFFANRYGSPEALGQTVYKDPVGFLADLSTFFTGAGAIASGAGKLGALGGIEDAANVGAKASQIARSAADLTNPLTPVIAGGKALASKVSTGGAPIAAQGAGFLTGAGADAATSLYRASAEGGDAAAAAKAALRGEIAPNAIVEEAMNALKNVATNQSSEYQSALEGLKNIKGSEDISPVLKSLDSQLGKFGITLAKDGGLDFSRSVISSAADQSKVQEIYDTVKAWGSKPGDRTPIGIDTLKRRIGNAYNSRVDGKPVGAFITPIKQSVRGVLSKVPGYDEMAQRYGSAQNLYDELQGTFSLSGRASEDTVFKKIIGALRTNDALKTEMLRTLSEAGGGNLEAKVAGASFAPYFARGLRGQLVEGGAVFAAMQGLLTPKFLAIALSTSPRIMGEFIMAIGATPEQASKFTQVLSLLKQIAPPAAQVKASQKVLEQPTADQSLPAGADTQSTQSGTPTAI